MMENWCIIWPHTRDDIKVNEVSSISVDLVPALMRCHKCGKTMQEDPGDENRWWRLFITPLKDQSTCPDCRPDK